MGRASASCGIDASRWPAGSRCSPPASTPASRRGSGGGRCGIYTTHSRAAHLLRHLDAQVSTLHTVKLTASTLHITRQLHCVNFTPQAR